MESKCKTCRYCKMPEVKEEVKFRYSWMHESAETMPYIPGIFCTAMNFSFTPSQVGEYPDISECSAWKSKRVKV